MISTSRGNILLTLFFTMLVAIVLGIGSPTTANCVITSTISAPAIIMLLMMDMPDGEAVRGTDYHCVISPSLCILIWNHRRCF